MALNTEELIAVIAGSIAGLIVLLGIIAFILYLCVGRKRRHQRSNQKQFAHRHLTPDTSLSKNSGLQPQHPHHAGDQRGSAAHLADPRLDTRLDPRLDPRNDPRLSDPRLPKVGSSNLWFGTPSLYTSGPSPVYQDMKRKTSAKSGQEQQPGFKAPPHGHMVYQQGGPTGSRIYHSQQVVPTGYPSDYRLQRTGSYMDLYSYPYSYDPYKDMNKVDNSRAMQADYHESGGEYYLDPYREREVRRTGRRVRRANSDVTQHSTRRAKVRKQRGEAPFDKQYSRESSRDETDGRGHEHKERRSRHSQSNERQLRSSDNVTRADVHKPKKQAPPPPKPKPKPDTEEVPESATDSAKLRAIERERAREKENALRSSNVNVITDYSRDNRGYVHDEPKSKDSSDLHVRPYNYEGNVRSSKYENPMVAKMAAMTETPKATLIPANKAGVEGTTINITNMPGTTTSSTESFHAEVSKKLERLQGRDGGLIEPTEGPVMTSTGKNSRSSRPTSSRARRGSDNDGKGVEDAFEFLDGYSDGEGTDFIGSGNITPTQMRDYDVTF